MSLYVDFVVVVVFVGVTNAVDISVAAFFPFGFLALLIACLHAVKPRCEIERDEIDDQDTLICTAFGNPVEVSTQACKNNTQPSIHSCKRITTHWGIAKYTHTHTYTYIHVPTIRGPARAPLSLNENAAKSSIYIYICACVFVSVCNYNQVLRNFQCYRGGRYTNRSTNTPHAVKYAMHANF